jgi:hypothetical protein
MRVFCLPVEDVAVHLRQGASVDTIDVLDGWGSFEIASKSV